MIQPPIFVVGMGRSGTTLLRLMLHHHPRIAIPYESGFLTAYQERIAEYGNLEDDANFTRLLSDLLNEPSLKAWDHTFTLEGVRGRVQTRSLGGAVDAIYSEYAAAKGKARWGDKSDYLDRIHLIHAVFPNAQFIHIIRDGRDVASSVLKLSWGPDDILRAAEWWNDYVWLARRVGAILGPERYLEVRYEELVEHSERELRRVCTFLGEDYSPAMLSYPSGAAKAIPKDKRGLHHGTDAAPDRSRTYAWKREMNPYDVALFNRHARRMLVELGYEIDTAPVNRFRLALRYLGLFSRRLRSPSAS